MHLALAAALPYQYPPRAIDVAEFHGRRQSYREVWERQKERFGHTGLQLWIVVVSVVLFGINNLFVDIALVMPKYIMWRYGEHEWFAIFMAINPLLITVLTPFVPVLRSCFARRGLDTVEEEEDDVIFETDEQATSFSAAFELHPWFAVGFSIMALAPLWAYFWPTLEGGIPAFLVQSTIGEAIAMPQIGDYHLHLVGRSRLAYSHAVVQLPLIVTTLVHNYMSVLLLNRYCPDEATCRAQTDAPVLWLAVSLLALPTAAIFALAVLFLRGKMPTEEESAGRGGPKKLVLS